MIRLKNQSKAIPRAQDTSIAVYNSNISKNHCGTFRDFLELVAGHRKLMDFTAKPFLLRAKKPSQPRDRKLSDYHRVGLKMAENKEINKNAVNRTLKMLIELISSAF